MVGGGEIQEEPIDAMEKLLVENINGRLVGRMVPLDAAEIAQREVDRAAAEAGAAARAQEETVRAALVTDLRGGKATSEQVQAALADLLEKES